MPVSKMKSSITFLLILVVLQFYLSCVNAALYGGAESSTASCNRFRSRIARNVIEEQIFPAADDVEYELPSDCPFARDNDILRLQELSKKEMWRDQWRCTVCSKVFKSEHFLDKHLENKHSSHISKNATVCLADMCDFLNCDNLIRQMHYDEALEDVPIENLGFDPTAPIICKDHVMERKKLACQAVMQRCFPPDNEATKYLNDLFDREFCQRMTAAIKIWPPYAKRSLPASRFVCGRSTTSSPDCLFSASSSSILFSGISGGAFLQAPGTFDAFGAASEANQSASDGAQVSHPCMNANVRSSSPSACYMISDFATCGLYETQQYSAYLLNRIYS
eukprot:CAMPEP_0196660356 /NCGR_PEP_ID=MMETSP1086-20130531/39260_1 /TAXON_ID=77921 /ORGANISM="Cyanoptyche  gloeocystis , Strain SAG4.97" /LENGTH=334 /DNA_ID=CAMNT_0041994707 /DNA_START=88 /DNA_END=1093 /DNA_ORIENTATION=+